MAPSIKSYFTFSLFALLLFFISCTEEVKEEPFINPIALSTPKELSEVETRMQHAQGEQLFKANCITCHSLRYIQMQPDFSEKAWEKIVDKMVKAFGAPISDSDQKIIVKYLVTIKGK